VKKYRWYIFPGIVVLIFLLVYRCCYTVEAWQYAIITSFGKPGAIQESPGLFLKWPTRVVNRFDKRLQYYQSALIEYLTGDKKNLILQTFVCWKIKDPLLFFQAVHNMDNANQKLDDIICSLVGSTLGDHTMNQIISTNSEEVLLRELCDHITVESQKRSIGYGIEIKYVGFSRLALPEDNARSVYRRMIAERSSIANEYRALGKQKATEIRAQADREKSDILAEAYKTAEITRGEGDAMAAEIYGSAYGKAPEFFQFLRTLEADKKILGSKTTIVLSSESELVRILNPDQ